eukprot:scaffold91573_cov18-Tisochrysis_lutea.AAC.5
MAAYVLTGQTAYEHDATEGAQPQTNIDARTKQSRKEVETVVARWDAHKVIKVVALGKIRLHRALQPACSQPSLLTGSGCSAEHANGFSCSRFAPVCRQGCLKGSKMLRRKPKRVAVSCVCVCVCAISKGSEMFRKVPAQKAVSCVCKLKELQDALQKSWAHGCFPSAQAQGAPRCPAENLNAWRFPVCAGPYAQKA